VVASTVVWSSTAGSCVAGVDDERPEAMLKLTRQGRVQVPFDASSRASRNEPMPVSIRVGDGNGAARDLDGAPLELLPGFGSASSALAVPVTMCVPATSWS
jgi:hypothetical protein